MKYPQFVVINLGNGNLHKGCEQVTVQLCTTGHPLPQQFTGSLPPAPHLVELYRNWQSIYRAMCDRINIPSRSEQEEDDELEIDEGGITCISESSFDELCQNLQENFNEWLKSEGFLDIEQQLRTQLDPSEEIRVIIQTNDQLLQRLPWHRCDFYRDYPKAEMALSRAEYKRAQRSLPKINRKKVRILAILGNSQGIDLEKERRLLKNLQESETVFLVKPSRQEFNRQLWDELGWDILFFAGHSQSEGETGRIYINENQTKNSLIIEQLEEALKAAIDNGLKLAIFNSCDGIGLAKELAKLNMPTIIVMREPVPNLVAQKFFQHFLLAFAQQRLSLYLAVQQARRKLQGLENEFFCASWLPVIVQNPALEPPSWLNLAEIQPNSYKSLFSCLEEEARHTLSRLAPKILFFAVLIGSILLGNFLGSKNKDLKIVSHPFFTLDSSERINSQSSQKFSQGEKILILQTTTPEKELAVAAFANGNYDEAASLFSASLKILPNDPEALIYLNNAQIGQEKSYSIAVSTPIGYDINAAEEILRGVAQAQTLFNQRGKIDGVPLKVQIVNDDNFPDTAQQVVTILTQNPEILGVVGHYSSDVNLATVKIYQSAQLVTISPISTSVKLSNLSPYFFRTVPSDYFAAKALAEYMLSYLKKRDVAVFYSSKNNYSQSLKSEFITSVTLGGGRVVSIFDLSNPNFSASDSFQQARERGAKVLMLAANTGTLDKALQVVQVNRQRLSLLAGDDVYTSKTLQIAGELAEDMVLSIPWHIKSNPDVEFAQVARKLWRAEVNWRTAMAYDAATALITAIERSPTRIGVQKVLSNPNFSTPGASNEIQFLPTGDRLNQIELVKIQLSERNSFRYEFTPIVSGR